MSAKKKKKSFLIIALVAIIVAEAGYILASFGIFSLGGGGKMRARTLDDYIYIICRLAGGTKDICSSTVYRTLSSYRNYNRIAFRIIDLNYSKNITLMRDEALYLLTVAKPLVDVFYTPNTNTTRTMIRLIEDINRSLGWRLNTLEYNVYTISYPSLFLAVIFRSSLFPRKIYAENMVSTDLKGENETITLKRSSHKPEVLIFISQANITFSKPIGEKELPNFLKQNFNVSAVDIYVHGNSMKSVKTYALYWPIALKRNTITFNIVAIYLINGTTRMILNIYSPYLVNSSVSYTLYDLRTPLVVIGNKVTGNLDCLIVGYRNLTELKDLVSKCIS